MVAMVVTMPTNKFVNQPLTKLPEFGNYVSGSKLRTIEDHIARELAQEQREAGDVDWSSHKCYESVKNQGHRGSCWTFSSTAVASFGHCLATAPCLSQQPVSCARSTGNGCHAGWAWEALDYIRETGVCTLSDYPCSSGKTKQDDTCSNACNKKKFSIGATVRIHGESVLQSALDNQPVQVSVAARSNICRNYKSGVVRNCPGTVTTHAVLAVRYGSNWGDQGYIYLERGVGGDGMCKITNRPSYPKIDKQPTPRPSTILSKPSTCKPKSTDKPQSTPKNTNHSTLAMHLRLNSIFEKYSAAN
ncbi:cysteine protease family C01A [Thraustotheca clavata]|uniref:Cysteine protease family C01A n=1 Tax=Thraustotheca clavata TaxID=74557 RepID=A0A1V9ZXI6_9STRA|nr:cysteine protease family C01A [Thraustotheca clavata]